jgi:hypothetical protein
VSDSFAPNESIAKFETRSGFAQFWVSLLFGGLAVVYAAACLPHLISGDIAPLDRQLVRPVGGFGLLLLGFTGWRNWWRVKWVRTANRGGIQWFARGRVWHRAWEQLARVHAKITILVNEEGKETLAGQVLTVAFTDGTEFRVGDSEFPEFGVLARYLQAKHLQAEATNRAAQDDAARSEAERDAADRVTMFGPLGIYRRGVEWDGIYFPWEQVEGYEVQQGVLIIRTVDGDEFLRRTADLGDWHTAVERLAAAAGKMAGRRAASKR